MVATVHSKVVEGRPPVDAHMPKLPKILHGSLNSVRERSCDSRLCYLRRRDRGGGIKIGDEREEEPPTVFGGLVQVEMIDEPRKVGEPRERASLDRERLHRGV